tara:strand:+ start:224 stop:487 length:264 start_codon:yes stop_codon:yes gene_type:complete
MLEFDSEEDLNQRAGTYQREAPKLFPNAEILLTIKTGPTSAMSVSIYPDEKSAEESLVRRNKHFKAAKVQPREAWYLEGHVVQRHVK